MSASRLDRLVHRVRDLCGRLKAARDGGVAIIFALSLPPLLLMAVAGVDIHRATTVRTNLQDALDAAALAAARSTANTNADIRTIGMRVLKANLANYPDTSLIETAADTDFVLNSSGTVVAKAKANVTTLIAGYFLGSNIKVAANSEVTRSNYKLEIALVIDNTGSMASNDKLETTKTAATNLVNTLAAGAARSVDPEAVQIALVPFSMTVRVNSGFTAAGNLTGAAANATWLSNATTHTGGSGSTGLFSTNIGRFSLFQTLGTGWGGCIEARPQPYDIRDTAPLATDQARMFVPYFAPDEPDEADYSKDTTWQGYDYEGNNYLDDLRSGSSSKTPFSSNSARETEWFTRLRNVAKYVPKSGLSNTFGPNAGCALQPIIRLTTDYAAIRTGIDNMVATGNTNVPLGLMWGWHAISPNAPFADGAAYGADKVQKIIIVMTDGENVMSAIDNPNDSSYNGLGYIWQNRLGITSGSDSARRTVMDNRMDSPTVGQEDLCGNIKAQGIIVYSIGVQVDSQAQGVLARCATDADHYFNVTSTAGISEAFDRIAGSISNLRISK